MAVPFAFYSKAHLGRRKTGGSPKSFLSLRVGPSAGEKRASLRSERRLCRDPGPRGRGASDVLWVQGGLSGAPSRA